MSALPNDLSRLAGAGDSAIADAPMPMPLPPDLQPVEPFPLAALPDTFRPWARDVAERMHCPPDFVAVPMLVAAASLVARRVAIRPQTQTDWTEKGNLWALIVGRPGLMKSPAMSAALEPMEKLEERANEFFSNQVEQHRTQALHAKIRSEEAEKSARAVIRKNPAADIAALLHHDDEPDAPVRKRYVVSDATYEKLGEILCANPEGVLSVRDEMRGLFLHLAREESAPARAFYLQAWSGGRYTFDRIGRGTVTVADARLSMIGGIQPGPLSELIHMARRGASDDGMLERFLIAWPDSPGQWREVDRWPDSSARRVARAAFDRLDALSADAIGAERDRDRDGEQRGMPYLRLSGDARALFSEWREEFEKTITSAENDGLHGALSKFRHHVPALALMLHVVDSGAGPVSVTAVERALALSDYFESHARRLHGSGTRTTLRAARSVLDRARAGQLPAAFTARDVYRNQWAGLGDRVVVGDALDLLAAHGWLTEVTAETGGRPTVVYVLVEAARRG
jgi:hypothetical protein